MPLLGIAAALVPSIAKYLFGDGAGEVAGKVASAAVEVFGDGADQPEALERAIASDPAKALAFKEKLLDIRDREAERAHQLQLAELQDLGSARAREQATGDATPRRLAFVIFGTFAAVSLLVVIGSGFVLAGRVTVSDMQLAIAVAGFLGHVVGYVSAKADQVVAYYFGSSLGSKAKTDQMAASAADMLKVAAGRTAPAGR